MITIYNNNNNFPVLTFTFHKTQVQKSQPRQEYYIIFLQKENIDAAILS